MHPSTSIRKDCCGARSFGHLGWVQGVAMSPNIDPLVPGGRGWQVASVDRAGFLHVHRVNGPRKLERIAKYNDGPELGSLTTVCWAGDDTVAYGSAQVIALAWCCVTTVAPLRV